MSDRDEPKGLTRRELFAGIGGGVLAASLLPHAAEAQHGGGATGQVLGPGEVRLTFTVNDAPRAVDASPRETLLSVLRDRLDLTGAKPVCERGACGACTVLVDGLPINSCMMLAVDVQGRAVRTVEGLARGDQLAPIQQAFVDHDALQCGFCTPGMVMSCTALLERNASPSLADVKRAVSGNLCRCGTYPKVFEATLAAAGKRA